MKLTETTPPGAEPLTLDEAKIHLRVEHDADDALIADLIAAARQMAELATGRSLITRSYSLWLDCLEERAVALPLPPLIAITRVNVYAADGTAAEFPDAGYYADRASAPGRFVLAPGAALPVPGRDVNGVEIQYKAGYGATPLSVPALLRQGLRQLVAYLYAHRGDDSAPTASHALMASGAGVIFQSYRVMQL